jgi:hypothetical protein
MDSSPSISVAHAFQSDHFRSAESSCCGSPTKALSFASTGVLRMGLFCPAVKTERTASGHQPGRTCTSHASSPIPLLPLPGRRAGIRLLWDRSTASCSATRPAGRSTCSTPTRPRCPACGTRRTGAASSEPDTSRRCC